MIQLFCRKQSTRWRRDNWCLDDVTPNMIAVDEYDWLYRPLDWPMGCILYDFPKLEGRFHGVTTDEGRGIVYYIPESSPHYTKQWSWGQSEWGRGNPGRPASNYYEPWSSGTNFAFFQTSAFEPQTRVSWEIAILPIQQGLDPIENNRQQLLDVVDQHIDERMDQLLDVQDVQSVSIDGDEISDTIFDPNNVDDNDEDDTSSSSSVDDTTNGFGRQGIFLNAISFLLIFFL